MSKRISAHINTNNNDNKSTVVKLRKTGHSFILTVPTGFVENERDMGTEYTVEKKKNGEIIYKPVTHNYKNIFDDPTWKNYDYRADVLNDPELQELKPVGKERIDW